MNHKKLGLFLLPLVPLTAIGVVEIVDKLIAPAPSAAITESECDLPVRPADPANHRAPNFAKPPHFAKPPVAQPQPIPLATDRA